MQRLLIFCGLHIWLFLTPITALSFILTVTSLCLSPERRLVRSAHDAERGGQVWLCFPHDAAGAGLLTEFTVALLFDLCFCFRCWWGGFSLGSKRDVLNPCPGAAFVCCNTFQLWIQSYECDAFEVL